MLKILDKYKNIKFSSILKDKKAIKPIVISIVIILLFQVVYVSKVKKVRMLEAEYKKIKEEVESLYSFIGGSENLKDSIMEIQQNMALLDNVFPSEKEVSNVIKELNKEARRFGVSVISVTPRDLENYKGHDGKELNISDYICKCMPLSLTVEARYRLLGEFLMSLKANNTPMITIEDVDIEKDDDIAPRIRAHIELTSYILGK